MEAGLIATHSVFVIGDGERVRFGKIVGVAQLLYIPHSLPCTIW